MLFKAESMDKKQFLRQNRRDNFRNTKIRRIIERNHHNRSSLPFQMKFSSFDKSFWWITMWEGPFSKERPKTVLWRSISWRFHQNSEIPKFPKFKNLMKILKISKSQGNWSLFDHFFQFRRNSCLFHLKSLTNRKTFTKLMKNERVSKWLFFEENFKNTRAMTW